MVKRKASDHFLLAGFTAVVLSLLLSGPGRLHAAEADTAAKPAIEDVRTMVEKWVETKRLISLEKRDFELAKQMLRERIELVKREIESLQGKINDAKQSINEADKKRDELIEENDTLKNAAAALSGVLESLEARVLRLLPRLPDPIRQRIKPLSQRLPAQPGQTKMSISERFQNVVGILNEIDKFNREITVTSEVRALADGTSVEVAAVYLGIGQAFYASADGKVAGIGTASADQWIWICKNEASPQITEVIAILKNEKVAAFVPLPVDIQ
jgi:FtsZ-binding cell division protein ZapB